MASVLFSAISTSFYSYSSSTVKPFMPTAKQQAVLNVAKVRLPAVVLADPVLADFLCRVLSALKPAYVLKLPRLLAHFRLSAALWVELAASLAARRCDRSHVDVLCFRLLTDVSTRVLALCDIGSRHLTASKPNPREWFVSFVSTGVGKKFKATSFTLPKPAGGSRTITAPDSRLRVEQTIAAKILTLVLRSAVAEPHSHYAVPGRSIFSALDRLPLALAGDRRWLVNLDVQKAYDTVDRAALLARLGLDGAADLFAGYIRRSISLEVWDRDTKRTFHPATGIGQGLGFSPILFQAYFNGLLGDFLSQRRWRSVIPVYLYADNCVLAMDEDPAKFLAEFNVWLAAMGAGVQLHTAAPKTSVHDLRSRTVRLDCLGIIFRGSARSGRWTLAVRGADAARGSSELKLSVGDAGWGTEISRFAAAEWRKVGHVLPGAGVGVLIEGAEAVSPIAMATIEDWLGTLGTLGLRADAGATRAEPQPKTAAERARAFRARQSALMAKDFARREHKADLRRQRDRKRK